MDSVLEKGSRKLTSQDRPPGSCLAHFGLSWQSYLLVWITPNTPFVFISVLWLNWVCSDQVVTLLFDCSNYRTVFLTQWSSMWWWWENAVKFLLLRRACSWQELTLTRHKVNLRFENKSSSWELLAKPSEWQVSTLLTAFMSILPSTKGSLPCSWLWPSLPWEVFPCNLMSCLQL